MKEGSVDYHSDPVYSVELQKEGCGFDSPVSLSILSMCSSFLAQSQDVDIRLISNFEMPINVNS